MPKVLDEIFSFEEMKERWNTDNPNEPYVRAGSPPSFYDLNKWIIRVDDNDKTISTTGWTEHPDYVIVGGTQSIQGSPRGHMSDLVPFRAEVIPNKPLLATFVNAPSWIAANEKTGWQITNIEPNLLNSIPKNIIKKITDYAEEKGAAWGIKPADKIEKSWHLILKRY
tara:strand:- start:899 stop:1402 length:504 start_codon:yes stop_codon:yes gene_type:complete